MMSHTNSLDLKLSSRLENLGFKAGVVSIKHLKEFRDSIEETLGHIEFELFHCYHLNF